MSIGGTGRVCHVGRTLLSTALMSIMGMTAVHAAQCETDGLRAPMGYYQIPEAREGGNYTCDRVEPYRGNMNFTSKYEGSDSARNELNEDAYQSYLDATKAIRSFEKEVIAAADDYQVDGDGSAARDCVLENLDAWAQANALLPEEINHVGEAVRKWALASAANAYLRVKLSSDGAAFNDERTARIENWFDDVADGVRGYYTDREPRKVNNHDYWAAWAVMSTSVATGNCSHWGWSMAKFEEAMRQITEDGYLPKELSREDRALEYLNYAMQPLTIVAVFAEVNGIPVHETYGEGFEALARNIVAGLDDASEIESITGYSQLTDGLHTPWGLAWMRPWAETWGELEGMSEFLASYGPVKSTRLGGDVEFLYRIDPRWPSDGIPVAPDLRIDY